LGKKTETFEKSGLLTGTNRGKNGKEKFKKRGVGGKLPTNKRGPEASCKFADHG